MSTGLYTQPQQPQYPQQSQFPSPQFPQPQPYAAPSRGGGNWIVSLMLIGGGVLLILSLLVVAAVWWAVSSVEGWIVTLGREGMVAMVQESEIPAEEKKQVVEQVDRVVAAYKAHEIGQEDLDRLLISLEESRVMDYITWYGAEEWYVNECDLQGEEQERARRAFQRALYGVSQGKVEMDEVFDALPDDEAFDRALQDSQEKAAEQVRKSITRMEELADKAGVPADPPPVDISDEVKKLVDEMLAKK